MAESVLGSLLICVLALAAAGCGGEDEGRADGGDGADPPWSAPAQGSPDGDAGAGVKSASEILERLRVRIADGRGHSDPSFQRDVEAVAAVLWPSEAAGADLQSARVHTEVANIAGDVSRWMGESEEIRKARAEEDPTDIALHAGFLQAAASGPEAYRGWCGGEGEKLLLAHKAAQRAKHFPPR